MAFSCLTVRFVPLVRCCVFSDHKMAIAIDETKYLSAIDKFVLSWTMEFFSSFLISCVSWQEFSKMQRQLAN